MHDAPCFVTDDPYGPQRIKLRVRDILDEIVQAVSPELDLDKYYGGSIVPHLVSSRYRNAAPRDLDPLFYASPPQSLDDLKKTFRLATNEALRKLTNRNVTCATYFKHDAQNERILYVRVGMEHHLDLRVLPQGSSFLPGDTAGNSMLLPMDDVHDLGKRLQPKMPPGSGLSVKATLRDWDQGVYRMVQDLTEESIRRPWKERACGKVPAHLKHESKLLDTLFDHFSKEVADAIEKFQQDNIGTELRHANFMSRVLDDVTPDRQVGLLVNAIVQVQQYPDSESKQTLLALLRKHLNLLPESHAPDRRALVDLVQSDAGIEKLTLWFHMVATLREPVLDQTKLPDQLDVERVEVEKTPWLRAYVPALGTHLILPDKPDVRALPRVLRDSSQSAEPVSPADIANLFAENEQESANFAALTPPSIWESAVLRKAVASRALALYKQAPTNALNARAQLVRASAVLDPERNLIAALQDVATCLGDAGAPFKALALQQRERAFGNTLKLLGQTNTTPNVRRDAWRNCKQTLSSSDEAAKQAFSAQIIAVLPSLFARLSVSEHGEVLPLIKCITGVLSDDAAEACHLLKASLVSGKRKNPTLVQAIDRLLAKHAKAVPQEGSVAGAALTSLVALAQWEQAWAHLKLQGDAVDQIAGDVAARLLEESEPRWLTQEPAIAVTLLGRVAQTETPLRAFWDDAKRRDTVLKAPDALVHVQRLIDTTPTPDFTLRRWMDAIKAQPALLKQALADTAPSRTTFLPLAELALDPLSKQFPDGNARLAFMRDTWLSYSQAPRADMEKGGYFIVRGLSHAAATTVSPPIPVDVATINAWFEAMRHCPKGSRCASAEILATMASSLGAHEDAARMLMDWSGSLAKDRPTRQRFATLARFVIEGLLIDTIGSARRLILAQTIALSVPAEQWHEQGTWPALVAHLFMELVKHGQLAAANRLRTHMHATLFAPMPAERTIGDIYRSGTPEQQRVWFEYALKTMVDDEPDLNAVRLVGSMLPSSIDDLCTLMAARQLVKPVSSGELLTQKLEITMTLHEGGSDAVKTYLDGMLAQLKELAEVGVSKRYGFLPLVRTYVKASTSDEDRHARLQDAYRWIGQEPSGNIDATAAFERHTKLHMLVAIAKEIFKDDPKGASTPFEWLVDNVLETPNALGMVDELLTCAERRVPDAPKVVLARIKAKVEQAAEQNRLADAFKLASRGLYLAQESLVPLHAAGVAELTEWVLDTMNDYRGHERLVLVEQATAIVKALKAVRPKVSTEQLREYITLLEFSLSAVDRRAEHLDPSRAFLRQEFVGAIVSWLVNPNAFKKGIRALLRAHKHLVNLPAPQQARIVAALQRAISTFQKRIDLQEEVLEWNDKTDKDAPEGAARAMEIVLAAVCGIAPLDGSDLLNYLRVLNTRRAVYNATSRAPWDNLLQKVVDAAKPGCLHGAEWKSDERYAAATATIRRSRADNASYLLSRITGLGN